MRWLLIVLFVACNGASKPAKTEPAKPAAPAAAAATTWPVPPGWRSETIPFPLDFAPTIAHTGAEELRFPKGFFDPASPEYWSYAFTWRTTDEAKLDAAALASELTLYFQGLIAAVDAKKQISEADRKTIVARAEAAGTRFTVTAHVFDAFKTAQPIDLTGWAERLPCKTGALWIFVLAPEKTSLRAQLDELATAARSTCDRG
ncbi:MAG: hypothetical protein M4D80_00890 [Myxococcota bacterium]|nr:hypothetical protein [Myxococcota bacterium]